MMNPKILLILALLYFSLNRRRATTATTNHKFLQQSLFPGIPPTIKFTSESAAPEYLRPYLKWRSTFEYTTSGRERYNSLLIKNGFQLSNLEKNWLGLVGIQSFVHKTTNLTKPFQKYNHLPGSVELGNKVKLADNLNNALMKFGVNNEEFKFFMESYAFPRDSDKIKHVMNKENGTLWIVKPESGSRSRGISITTDYKDLKTPPKSNKQYLVQRYLINPYLTKDNRTIQVRTFVLVTSVLPLRVYLGYGNYFKLGVSAFNLTDLNNTCGLIYSELTLEVCNSTMESNFAHFDTYFTNNFNATTQKSIKSQIDDNTIRIITSVIPNWEKQAKRRQLNSYNAFQLFSFDYTLDNNYQVRLLEVNSHSLLYTIKGPVNESPDQFITDWLNIAGYQLPPTLPKIVKHQLLREVGQARSYNKNPLVFNECFYSFPTKESLSMPKLNWQNNNNNISLDILKMLIIAEDELHRSKLTRYFHRIYPAKNMRKYLQYLDKDSINYNAALVMANWEENYGKKGQNRNYAVDFLTNKLRNVKIC